jgi:hypothetical protein
MVAIIAIVRSSAYFDDDFFALFDRGRFFFDDDFLTLFDRGRFFADEDFSPVGVLVCSLIATIKSILMIF